PSRVAKQRYQLCLSLCHFAAKLRTDRAFWGDYVNAIRRAKRKYYAAPPKFPKEVVGGRHRSNSSIPSCSEDSTLAGFEGFSYAKTSQSFSPCDLPHFSDSSARLSLTATKFVVSSLSVGL